MTACTRCAMPSDEGYVSCVHQVACPTCNREGVVPVWGGAAIETCETCDGTGYLPTDDTKAEDR